LLVAELALGVMVVQVELVVIEPLLVLQVRLGLTTQSQSAQELPELRLELISRNLTAATLSLRLSLQMVEVAVLLSLTQRVNSTERLEVLVAAAVELTLVL
jgi:hypothetical protein